MMVKKEKKVKKVREENPPLLSQSEEEFSTNSAAGFGTTPDVPGIDDSVFEKLDEIKNEVDGKLEKKSSRGRTKKSEIQDRDAFVHSATLAVSSVAVLINESFPEACKRPLSQVERDMLDEAAGREAEKIFPALLENATEFALGLAVVSIFVPRLIDYGMYRREEAKRAKRGNNNSRQDGIGKDNAGEERSEPVSKSHISGHDE